MSMFQATNETAEVINLLDIWAEPSTLWDLGNF